MQLCRVHTLGRHTCHTESESCLFVCSPTPSESASTVFRATFHPATLGKEHEPHAWRRFTYAWKAKSPGTTTLAVRATDVRGSVQPKDGVWNPSGYLFSGWHTATDRKRVRQLRSYQLPLAA